MSFVLVQRGSWQGVEADIELESSTAAAFFTSARDYCAETSRPMPEIAEPAGGLRTTAQTTEMRWAFDHGPHGMYAHSATAAERAQSDALYLKYNMSRVSTGRPVINGTHTTGFYFDVATAAFQTWLLTNGHRYGLTRPLGDADPNHWKYTPGTATAALDVTSLDGGASTQVRTPPMTDTRIILAHHLSPAPFFYRVQLGTGALTASQYTQEQANLAAQAIGAVTFEVNSDAELKALQAVLASIPASPGGSGGPVTVNAQVDVQPELVAALKDPTVLAALAAAIKIPTKIESTLS